MVRRTACLLSLLHTQVVARLAYILLPQHFIHRQEGVSTKV